MAVYKEGSTWRAVYRYTDWQGQRRQTQKRGFPTKREALAWEREQLNKKKADLNMTFSSFVERYSEDVKNRIKENTWYTKEHILRTKILPYFGNRKIGEIQSKDVIAWQNEMINMRDENGKPYSPVYLKTLHNQLSALFNHAVKYYGLHDNPAAKVGNMGKERNREMLFWTQEEYAKFAEEMMDKPVSYYAFEMLYWCGIREGELLALTPEDFDLDKGTVSISKTYNRINGRDVITDPKTPKSNRVVRMPDFLVEEMRDYMLVFDFITASEQAGVKRIRIHDLRHSHISLLIQLGYSAVAIADRVGHESIDITYRYAHLFPSTQGEMAKSLNNLRTGEEEDVD